MTRNGSLLSVTSERTERSDSSPLRTRHVAVDKNKDISTYSSGYGGGYGAYGWGYGGGWAGGTSTTSVRDILVGTLVVDIADAGTRKLAWRGLGVKEINVQASPEKRDKGFTHCFILTFKTEKDRDDYLVHPEHTAFVKVALPVIDDVFVIDFWAKN